MACTTFQGNNNNYPTTNVEGEGVKSVNEKSDSSECGSFYACVGQNSKLCFSTHRTLQCYHFSWLNLRLEMVALIASNPKFTQIKWIYRDLVGQLLRTHLCFCCVLEPSLQAAAGDHCSRRHRRQPPHQVGSWEHHLPKNGLQRNAHGNRYSRKDKQCKIK